MPCSKESQKHNICEPSPASNYSGLPASQTSKQRKPVRRDGLLCNTPNDIQVPGGCPEKASNADLSHAALRVLTCIKQPAMQSTRCVDTAGIDILSPATNFSLEYLGDVVEASLNLPGEVPPSNSQ